MIYKEIGILKTNEIVTFKRKTAAICIEEEAYDEIFNSLWFSWNQTEQGKKEIKTQKHLVRDSIGRNHQLQIQFQKSILANMNKIKELIRVKKKSIDVQHFQCEWPFVENYHLFKIVYVSFYLCMKWYLVFIIFFADTNRAL